MERYPKLFILASIGYLLAGVLLGVYQGAGPFDPLVTRFVHVHLNLLGFMAMFIYGVAYHILPRFNARPVTNAALIPAHFYLVNIGLFGMVGFALFDGVYGSGMAHYGFLTAAILETAGIFIFAYNLIPVMMPEKTVSAPIEYKPSIDADMKVAEVLDKWPGLTDVFIEHGFKSLANPAARATFAKAVTIKQACKIHKVEESAFLDEMNSFLESGAGSKPKPAAEDVKGQPAMKEQVASGAAKGKTISRGELAVENTLIGSLLEAYPETKPIFEKHYGAGCFSCPGQAFETISQTATMHGIQASIILDDINKIIESALGAGKTGE